MYIRFEIIQQINFTITMKDNSFMLENYFPKKENVFTSPYIQRNALIFSIFMILIQIGLSLIYGFLIYIPTQYINIGSVITMIALAILIIAGFGLVFGYTKRLIWSGIGFNFLITALCIELYPLINDFWTRTELQNNNSPLINFKDDGSRFYNLFLANRDTSTITGVNNNVITYYGNCLTNALKCALSIVIAFSSVLGRAGHLECLFVILFGTVGFELNRQIIQEKKGADAFGTFYIFTFGGFMGLALGLFSLIREKRSESKQAVQNNRENSNESVQISLKRYTGKEYSVLYAIFGSLIIFALFPFLAYEIDPYIYSSNYASYINPICVILAMGASTLGSIFVSTLINGQIIARDVIHGPIAGAIAVGASSLYITTPVWAIVAGCGSGIIQAFIQNTIQHAGINRRLIVSTVSWSLFGLQGLIGAGFASGWKAISYTSLRDNSLVPIPGQMSDYSPQFELYAGLISAGIGAAFGLGAGLVGFIFNGQLSSQYFEDYFYWQNDDGLKISVDKSQPPRSDYKIPIPVAAVPEPQVEASEVEFDFSEGEQVINEYAYL